MNARADRVVQQTPGGDPDQIALCLSALRAFVRRRLPDDARVEDLVQEAYVRLLARAQQGAIDEPQAYLFRIARNLLADLHRRPQLLRAASPIDEDCAAVPPDQEDARMHHDLQARLASALAELPPRCRAVFLMRRFDELDTGEVAARLGISRRMVQKYLVRAVAHLYRRLGDCMENPR